MKLALSLRRSVLGSAVALACALAPTWSMAGVSYSSLYVFGDSLSDATGGNNSNPLAPNEGGLNGDGFVTYVDGHFSDGKVAAEYLAGKLGLDAAHAHQYAIGGARTGLDGQFPGTGLLSQIGAFSAIAAGQNFSNSLFMVWAGANDFRDAIPQALGLMLTNNDPAAAWQDLFTNLDLGISTLYALGARSFLLPNLPDVGITPEGYASGAGPLISMLVDTYNTAWSQDMNALLAKLPGADFRYADVLAKQHELVDGAPGNGLLNVTNGCIVEVAGAPAGNGDCSTSFFVDNVHPTTLVHAALGDTLFAAATVPEPGSMLLTALAVAGAAAASARRRARG